MTDCIQCQEWELCPFHPKEKPDAAHDYDVSAEAPIVFINLSQHPVIVAKPLDRRFSLKHRDAVTFRGS